ncbi:HIRAN domain-containing protein [Hymenobacter sp. BT491]|uniref:HIRAN domain-containing protein n=1 Tax=Hymenobacter sp. BT491 TaxID=2766779 RepID=UPI001653646C|nr:HIRAN domain-containing protein [Hymenobacter sp. BT491]MBC6990761.1 HIRAN domain-containing protein [Hymenobacter sp. BT491]
MNTADASAPLVLLECLVAGTTHRPNLKQHEPGLYLGQPLRLIREADSKYDDWAVQVHTEATDSVPAVWLGYLPEGRNETVARLLEAGKNITARLVHKSWEEDWLYLEIEVLLND